MKQKVKVGDIVHVVFWDHAQDSKDAMLFEIFGRVVGITRKAYEIYFWRYVNDVDRVKDDHPDNEDSYAIVKSTIESIRKLK